MSYTITVNVTEHLKSNYPNLTTEQIDLIAGDVSNRWDYTLLTNNVDLKCRETATYANIPMTESFNTEYIADFSDNELDAITEENEYEPMEHSSEGC
tara:strand:+ start:1024 stop:1314 length:291 start_codon:yes stop_codon:yes gene_type:complete